MPLKYRDTQINVVEKGSGEPVVFLHGSGGSTADWELQIEALAPDYRTISIDLRGFGKSTVTRENLSLQDYADDVVGVLDSLGIERAAIVGTSLGGIVALQLAVSAPERVTGLVAANATSFVNEQLADAMVHSKTSAAEHGMAANAQMMRPVIFAAAGIERDAAHIRDYEARFSTTDPEAFGLAMQAVSRIDLHENLVDLAVPTLVLAGNEDQLLPVDHSERIAESIPGAELKVIEGASHLSNLDQPEIFNDLVRGFLSTVY